jgi:signal transduction histidine kinase
VLVPAVCAGLYESIRHTILAREVSLGLGTWIAVLVVFAISYPFARISFAIIRRTEARLRERNRALEALSRAAERLAMMEERDRLAREMHDGIAQVLAYMLVRLDTVDGLLGRGRAAAAQEEIRLLRASGQDAYNDVREAVAGLRTRPEAGAAGLAAALREYSADFGSRAGVEVVCTIGALDTSGGDLGPAAELQLMRIAQEALTNVRKYARARLVEISFGRADGDWRLVVRDDGIGFDPAAAPGSRDRHFGLTMMRERAAAAGGMLAVTSAPGNGTTVEVVVPSASRPSAVQPYGGAHDEGRAHGEPVSPQPRPEAALIPRMDGQRGS